MFCSECGYALSGKGRFCANCGASVIVPEPSGQPVAAPILPGQAAAAPGGAAPAQPVGPPPIQPTQAEPPAVQPVHQTLSPPVQRPSMDTASQTAADTAFATLPPVQMVTPADEGPERIIAQFSGELKSFDKKQKDWPGVWTITNKRIIHSEYDEYEEEEPFQLGPLEAVQADNLTSVYLTRDLHSITWEGVVTIEVNFHFFNGTPNGRVFRALLPKKTFERQFLPAIQEAVPGITLTMRRETMTHYYLNVSEADPRNPFGDNYNPRYPRAYVVADLRELKKNPHAIDQAILDGRRAGVIPNDWDLLKNGIGAGHLPPGVPCLSNEDY